MAEYLSKEEIKQWRSSLEKITLEEYAQRLGKVISEEKETNDLIDIVLKKPSGAVTARPVSESVESIAQKALDKERFKT